jgi:hypothetical protein
MTCFGHECANDKEARAHGSFIAHRIGTQQILLPTSMGPLFSGAFAHVPTDAALLERLKSRGCSSEDEKGQNKD